MINKALNHPYEYDNKTKTRSFYYTIDENQVYKATFTFPKPSFLGSIRRLNSIYLLDVRCDNPNVVINDQNSLFTVFSSDYNASGITYTSNFHANGTTSEKMLQYPHTLHVLRITKGVYSRKDLITHINELLADEFDTTGGTTLNLAEHAARTAVGHTINSVPTALVRLSIDDHTGKCSLINSLYSKSIIVPPNQNYTNSNSDSFLGLSTITNTRTLLQQTHLHGSGSILPTLGFKPEDGAHTNLIGHYAKKQLDDAGATLILTGTNSLTVNTNGSNSTWVNANTSFSVRGETSSGVNQVDTSTWANTLDSAYSRHSSFLSQNPVRNVGISGSEGTLVNTQRNTLSQIAQSGGGVSAPVYVVVKQSGDSVHQQRNMPMFCGSVLGYARTNSFGSTSVISFDKIYANAKIGKNFTVSLFSNGSICNLAGGSCSIALVFECEDIVQF